MYNEAFERAGSCAIIAFIIDDRCFIANVGDSRAILSAYSGKAVYKLSRDFKPTDIEEQNRILQNGGKVYYSHFRPDVGKVFAVPPSMSTFLANDLGPCRVMPGRLSVSRALGDAQAKLPRLGGNPNVIIAEPEIREFTLMKEYDFILLGSDGVFDKLTNREVANAAWRSALVEKDSGSLHACALESAVATLKRAMNKKTFDNVSCALILFENFQKTLHGSSATQAFDRRERKNGDVGEEQMEIDSFAFDPDVEFRLKSPREKEGAITPLIPSQRVVNHKMQSQTKSVIDRIVSTQYKISQQLNGLPDKISNGIVGTGVAAALGGGSFGNGIVTGNGVEKLGRKEGFKSTITSPVRDESPMRVTKVTEEPRGNVTVRIRPQWKEIRKPNSRTGSNTIIEEEGGELRQSRNIASFYLPPIEKSFMKGVQQPHGPSGAPKIKKSEISFINKY